MVVYSIVQTNPYYVKFKLVNMPSNKFSLSELIMTVVITDCDGNVISEFCSASSAQLIFQKFVIDCVGRHSYIREISLYDSSNRLYKSYKQYF